MPSEPRKMGALYLLRGALGWRWFHRRRVRVLGVWRALDRCGPTPEVDHQQENADADGAIGQVEDSECEADLPDAEEQEIGDVAQAEAVNQVAEGAAQDQPEAD